MKLNNKVALVTGASEGIGRAIVEKLTKSGVRVIAVSRNIENSDHFSSKDVTLRNCDVSNIETVKNLAVWIKKEYGQLDIVVNNAGVWQKLSPLEEVKDETIGEIVSTNLLGTIYVTKYCLPLLRESEESALVNVVSKSGVSAQAGQSVYTASKYGIRGFTDVLREDLKNTNIHVLAVYQAGTNTKMFEKTGENFSVEDFTEPNDLADKIVLAIGSPNKLWINELHVNYR